MRSRETSATEAAEPPLTAITHPTPQDTTDEHIDDVVDAAGKNVLQEWEMESRTGPAIDKTGRKGSLWPGAQSMNHEELKVAAKAWLKSQRDMERAKRDAGGGGEREGAAHADL